MLILFYPPPMDDYLAWLIATFAIILTYLLGSINFSVCISRCLGFSDPRSYGSKNPGATNVLRSGHKKIALLTLLLDAAKVYLPVALLKHLGSDYGLSDMTYIWAALAGFLGHLYPVFLRFRGGKGVASFFGATLGIEPGLGLLAIIMWLAIAVLSRYSSLAALGSVVTTFCLYLLLGGYWWYPRASIALVIGIMASFIIWRHKKNIVHLLNGTESKIKLSKNQ